MRWRALAGLAWLVGVLAASAHAEAAEGWARPDLRPVTQPAPVGGLFVLYVAQGGDLGVVGLDAATGATVWSNAASTSEIAPGVAPALVVAQGNVIYLARRAGATAALVATDAQTGTQAWSTEEGTFTGIPGVCSDDRSAVCTSGRLGSDTGEATELRFDLATGRRLAAPAVSGPSPRELGLGLYDTGARHPERLSATRGTAVAWSRALARIFPARGATSDYGWNFGRFNRLGLFVGSVGTKPTSDRARDVFDLAKSMTVGFRIADGVVKWRTRGRYTCTTLPCPGESQAGYTNPDAGGDATVGLRLIERGTWSFPHDNLESNGTISGDARAIVEGFLPASGRALWRFDAGRNTGLINGRLIPAQTAAHTVVLTGPSGKLVALNLASGARRTVAAAARGWCRKTLTYRQTVGYQIDTGTIHRYTGQHALVWCSARSQQRLAPPPQAPAFIGDIGARNAGLIAWSDTTGVIAEPEA